MVGIGWAWLCVLVMGLSWARDVRLLDFDGTIVDDHSPQSSWRTYWVLVRNDEPTSAMQVAPSGVPATLRVSYRDYLHTVRFLGRSDVFNSLTPLSLEPDPIQRGRPNVFIPGHYYVDPAMSFKYYRPAVGRGKSYLVRDYLHARERTEILNSADEAQFSWRGPAWSIWAAGLAQPETVQDTKIFTSRWHHEWEWGEWLRLLKEHGEIRQIEALDHAGRMIRPVVHNLKSPEARVFSRISGSLAEKKVQVVLDEAMALLHSPGREKHRLLVAEDEPRYVEAIGLALRDLSGSYGYRHRIQLFLFNTGLDWEREGSPFADAWTVFEDGFHRPATADEIASWSQVSSSEAGFAITARACSSLFGRGEP